MGISSSAPWLKYYDSTPAHLDYPKKTIYEMVRAAADKYPKNIAYEFMGKKTTFAEFMERIDRTAKAYLAMGIGKGDRVTICMPNCPQALDSFYALNRIGAVSNMIHPLSAASEIKFYLDFSKSKAILTLDQFYGKVAGILPELANKDTMLLVARIVDELPPGRKPVSTHLIPPQREEDMLAYLHRQALAGKQIFVVCPAVEESDADLMSASACAEMLREKMGEVGIVLVHGRMKSAEKEAAMRDFAQGKAHILVATTVIEVGVDVPAAVIMVIENAERFGLSQLHQLRGRVGRGTEKSYCFLVSEAQGQAAKERLGVLCREQDGFAIAAQDLRLRGPGDYVSAVRRGGIYPQSGALQFALADPAHDMELLQQALGAANALSEEDPTLVLPQHNALRALVFGESLQANT